MQVRKLFSDGQTLQNRESGQVYTFRRLIGQGAHGQVWLVVDQKGSSFAMKAVLPTRVDSSLRGDKLESLVAEISRMQKASEFMNEFVPKFFESFTAQSKLGDESEDVTILAIVMEYIDGCSVDVLIRIGPLPELHAAIILHSVCRALQRMHSHGMLHRDIKSGNIMVSRDGRVLLCDFGVSKQLEAGQRSTSTIVGSPLWMAPEVIKSSQSSARPYSYAADVWSVGITAIELVEGRPPLSDNPLCRANACHVFRMVAKEPAPQLGSQFSRDLRHFVARCLVKSPDQRATIDMLLEEPFLKPFPAGSRLIQSAIAVATTPKPNAAHDSSNSQKDAGYATLTLKELRRSLAQLPDMDGPEFPMEFGASDRCTPISAPKQNGNATFSTARDDEVEAVRCRRIPRSRVSDPGEKMVAAREFGFRDVNKPNASNLVRKPEPSSPPATLQQRC